MKAFNERREGSGGPEFVGPFPFLARVLIMITLAVAFLELQPRAVVGLFKLAKFAEDSGFEANIARGMNWSAGVLTPLGGIAAIMFRRIAAMAAANEIGQNWEVWATKAAAKIGLLILALFVPLLLWAAYVYLCYWGIEAPGPNPFLQTPQWLIALGSVIGRPSGYSFALLYLVMGSFFVATSSFLAPNSNSLHRLYRDRLSDAFILGPKKTSGSSPNVRGTDLRGRDDEVAITKHVRLSKLANTYAPYPLFNVALNIQNSRYVNKRGRNADFFILSPFYVGSDSTGYAETIKVESAEPDLDLGAAMAISGAAYSPDMGSKTVRLFTPTLALLNIRLGYWMRNPALIRADGGRPAPTSNPLYLFKEMFGLLDESSRQVYLTDGGHIDSLGIYELLRRRCSTIIAIDANADPEMTFSDFVKVQQYARIDLGIRIELPWQAIRERSLATSVGMIASVNGGADPDRHTEPHAAWGRILYPGGSEGRLLYIKASLTGDENDYILNYKRRYPTFPHEDTADQFFSEEQFEVYRALGFHATHKVAGTLDKVASTDETRSPSSKQEPQH